MSTDTKLILSLVNRIAVRVSIFSRSCHSRRTLTTRYFLLQLPSNNGTQFDTLESDPLIQQT
jgi:hypothetical protein